MKLGFIKRPSAKLSIAVVVIILVAGAAVGLIGFNTPAASTTTDSNGFGSNVGNAVAGSLQYNSGSGASGHSSPPSNQPISGTTAYATSTVTFSSSSSGPSTQPVGTDSGSQVAQENSPQLQSSNQTGYIEYFSNVTLQVSSTETALSKATAVAYAYGGNLAFSSYSNTSSIAVLRVPAENYASALSQIEGLGNLTSMSSYSNDVSVQYTDLNATLESLLTEQASLLKLENSSTSLNATLLLEGQIENVDTQINEIQGQILQTSQLIEYSTITATFNLEVPTPAPIPLSMKLTATPTSGLNPLSVTFNVIVNGGTQPYIINYNFGDGTTYQGQSLIHTFTSAGTFNVTVTVTDASGNAIENFTIIRVKSPPVATGLSSFGSCSRAFSQRG